MTPTTRIRNLRQSGVPRRLVHRYVSTVSRFWARHAAAAVDARYRHVTAFSISPQEPGRKFLKP